MYRTTAFLLALAIIYILPMRQSYADGIASVDIVGTSFHVVLTNGKTLETKDLVGAVLMLDLAGTGKRSVRIDSVSPDPRDKDSEVLLYKMSLRDDSTGTWSDACGPDPDGKHLAFPLKGKWDVTGHRFSEKGLTLACTNGALGKCVRFGYKPWKVLKDGTSLLRYHEACVHLVRADYCGNDSATTRTGTPIDIFDNLGIQNPEVKDALPFEAAWDEHGAICVAHTRIPEKMTLAQLGLTCPRLVAHLGTEKCSENLAKKQGIPLFSTARISC